MDSGACLEKLFREEYGRIIAGLIRVCGSFDLAEDALQEAFAAAARVWPENGTPQNPAAWITTAAQRRLIDAARREKTRRVTQGTLQYEHERAIAHGENGVEDGDAMPLADDRLRLIFTCCHPALNRDAQIALTLRTLSGLTTGEIAKAFLVTESTMAQRLVRAKRKIQEARIPYQVPSMEHLPERVAAVRVVVYLIFNEGYAAASGDQLVRGDLCGEAIRLGRTLRELLPADRENAALLALMLLHDARRAARMRDGELITLEEQNRSLWNRQLAAEGLTLVTRLEPVATDTPFYLQAKIAACHMEAPAAARTDWHRIRYLYARLLQLQNTPVVALNCAVATAMSVGLAQGLAEIDLLEQTGDLSRYYLLHAARADILRRMKRFAEAAASYRSALLLTANKVEGRYLARRLSELEALRNQLSSS